MNMSASFPIPPESRFLYANPVTNPGPATRGAISRLRGEKVSSWGIQPSTCRLFSLTSVGSSPKSSGPPRTIWLWSWHFCPLCMEGPLKLRRRQFISDHLDWIAQLKQELIRVRGPAFLPQRGRRAGFLPESGKERPGTEGKWKEESSLKS